MNAQLKFNYLGYGNTFIKNIPIEGETLYVFSDFSLKNMFLKEREVSLFEYTSPFLTIEEFKEKIYITPKIILKETKKILSLYKSLSKEIKDKLDIENYYDIIDFADHFFKFFKDLNINLISELKELEEWQKEYLKNFFEMKEDYLKLLEEYNYLPLDWLESIENLDLNYLKSFKKLVFVDIPYFSPLDKLSLEKISEIIPVEFFLQMSKEDFNEKDLQLETISFPKKCSLQVFNFNEPLEELIGIFHLRERATNERADENVIFSADIENNFFNRTAPKHFSRITPPILNETEIYKFMEAQYTLLMSKEETLQAYPLIALKDALKTRSFKNFYEVTHEDLEALNHFIDEDWKYVSLNILEREEFVDFPISLKKLLEELNEVENFKSIEEFIAYFQRIILSEFFKERQYKDLYSRFQQALQNTASIQSLNLHQNFSEYFTGKLSLSLYKLLLQYMDKIDLIPLKFEDKISYTMRRWNFARLNFKKSYFVGVNNKTLPNVPRDGFILTERQKKVNGFLTEEKQKFLQKYRFYQAVFNSKESIIFSPTINSTGIESSAFVEELIFKYGIKVQDTSISSQEVSGILQKLFFSDAPRVGNTNLDPLPKEYSDFVDGKLKLGYYDYSLINICSYKFYFEKLAKVLPEDFSNDVLDINSRFIGRFAHDVLEVIAKDHWLKFLKNGIFAPSEEEIEDYLQKFYRRNLIKIPVYLTHYFTDVLIPHLRRNIHKFYIELEREYKGKKIKKFFGEKGRYSDTPFLSDKIDIYLSGRADLVIEAEPNDNCIVDYKTGNGDAEQLDFYAINLYGDSSHARGYLKNVWDNTKGKTESKGILTAEILTETLKQFVEQESYTQTEKQSICTRCSYKNLCRR
jgi:hypothetical protein